MAERDRDYFRASRQKRVGTTLEAFVADRNSKLKRIPRKPHAFAQCVEGATVLWRRAATLCRLCHFRPVPVGAVHQPFELLETADPVRLWRDRLLDGFDGLARLRPLTMFDFRRPRGRVMSCGGRWLENKLFG